MQTFFLSKSRRWPTRMSDVAPKRQVSLALNATSLNAWLGGRAYLEGLTDLASNSEDPGVAREIVVLDTVSRKVFCLEDYRRSIKEGGSAFGSLSSNSRVRNIAGALASRIWLAFVCRKLSIKRLFPAPMRYTFLYGSDRSVNWIPDFQHIYFPHNFTRKERRRRNKAYSSVLRRRGRVVLSSHSSAQDARTWLPGSRASIRVFPPRFPLPELARKREYWAYEALLPKRFLYCGSTWWPHKGLESMLDALTIATSCQPSVKMVFTGVDRDKPSSHYSRELLSKVDDLGLGERVLFLGTLSRIDQLEVMNRSVAVVQASNFEGWNLQVEEAIRLGVPLVISDLPVHREQTPVGPVYWFTVNDSKALAEQLLKVWCNPGSKNRYEAPPFDLEHSWTTFVEALDLGRS